MTIINLLLRDCHFPSQREEAPIENDSLERLNLPKDIFWANYVRNYRDPVFTGGSSTAPTFWVWPTAPSAAVYYGGSLPTPWVTVSTAPWPPKQRELSNTPPVDLNPAPASVLNQATDQPMPDHLNANERNEIELLLLRIFRQDADAIAFLSAHNAGLRAKPLDLIQRDQAGVTQLLAYLRQAVANQPPLDPVSRLLE